GPVPPASSPARRVRLRQRPACFRSRGPAAGATAGQCHSPYGRRRGRGLDRAHTHREPPRTIRVRRRGAAGRLLAALIDIPTPPAGHHSATPGHLTPRPANNARNITSYGTVHSWFAEPVHAKMISCVPAGPDPASSRHLPDWGLSSVPSD